MLSLRALPSVAFAALLATVVASPSHAGPLVSAPKSPPPSSSQVNTRVTDGFAALKNKDLAAASRAFEEASRLDPASPLPHLGLADVAATQGRTKLVEEQLKKALALAPANSDVQRAWGRWRFSQADYAGSEAALKRASELAPEAAVIWIDLGDLYRQGLKRPTDAETAYRKAVALSPDHAGARFGLGMSLLAQHKAAEARSALSDAVRLAPKNPQAHFGLGRAELANRDLGAASAAFERAYALDPGYTAALVAAADVKQASGDAATAVSLIDRAAATPSAGPAVRLRQGELNHLAGHADKAFDAYAAVMQAEPRNPIAYNNAAALAAERRTRLDQALAWARRATSLDPRQDRFRGTLALVHDARGETAEAIRVLEQITASASPRADALFLLGDLREREGRKDAAEAYRRALSIDPAFPRAAEAKTRLERLGRNG